ncbi:MAG: carbohydrate porin [Bdellovibrionales bacterium]|nr:carbohydrate porin [Bdellovibrionales bacterium]
MKKLAVVSSIILSVSILLGGALSHAADMDYDLYFRTPVGTNGSGGKHIPLSNPGSRGNEFRLGNETAYGEASFTGHALRGKAKSDPFFNANLTFAYDPAMNSQYNDTSATGDRTYVVQAFVKGGNIDNQRFSYWAGKRFYRDADIFMNDFFYFANMRGNGGGIEDIQLSNGTLSAAWLQYSDRTLTSSTIGLPAKQALDLRWKDFTFATDEKLMFWLAQANTAPGTGATSTGAAVDFQAESGTAAGVRWTHSEGQSTNNLAFVYGTSIMENFELDNTAYAVTGANVSKKNRWRLVNNYNTELNAKWAFNAAAIIETADNGQSSNSKSHWYSVGIRPLYYFSDHFHLATGIGYSLVGADSEVSTTTGTKPGDRSLMRITVAPQVAIGKGFYKRPVIRTFVTYTSWNDANKDLGNTESLVAKLNAGGNRAMNNKDSAVQFGVEGEIWF